MIRIITREQILTLLSRVDTKLVFVDSTSLESYEKLHLPRAVLISPANVVQAAASYFPNRATTLVVYGEKAGDPNARQVADALLASQYFNLFLYDGGKEEWARSGLSTEAPIRPMASPQSWNVRS